METVLVTGGAGFIGSHLCERLISMGYNIINLDCFNDFYKPTLKMKNIDSLLLSNHYKLVKGDIRDHLILEHIFSTFHIEKIVHLAALAGVRKSIGDPLEYIDVDISGTVNLLEFAAKYHVNKFVFASSSSVYGNSRHIPFKENDPLDLQISPYATAKRCGELYCATYNRLYGIPIVILRFFTVYGPRQRPEMAINLFTRCIDKGIKLPLYGDGTTQRDYTYIDDIVDGIVSAIGYECSYEAFNLGSSNPISLKDMLELIEVKLNKRAITSYLPDQLGEVKTTYADINKSKNQLGYCPKVSFDSGIERFIDWYLKNKEIYDI
ncbi:GDP-mannose 4,6-dehydratase [Petroclostridium sp. X23]|uniref:GDP-mannose 4,6-dehydratase n=1 Tax=Petroclostridium sp. X23 TaxID=3045146 RepID=UPI0024AD5FEB|nr:GDP-mannose 4,6-dehydratase [Petroclostridium sp. X23]WHH58356.1 GDP-mannose 4,6-dehydratase [Petroclostridium sp. X23]